MKSWTWWVLGVHVVRDMESGYAHLIPGFEYGDGRGHDILGDCIFIYPLEDKGVKSLTDIVNIYWITGRESHSQRKDKILFKGRETGFVKINQGSMFQGS